MIDPTLRFSSRVENYIKYRPSYPSVIVAGLSEKCGLVPTSIIADIGSGTGILSELFLQNGNRVYGVEPNREMRDAGVRLLREHANFSSVTGRAEATTLSDHSVDFVTAGQAFHWFDAEKAKTEFTRILKPGGWVILVWNERPGDTSPLLAEYEALLHCFALEYDAAKKSDNLESDMEQFFGHGMYELIRFDNFQILDFDSFKGRLMSSSYAPLPEHPSYAPMISELRAIFQKHQVNEQVVFSYDTKVYYGRLQ